MNFFCPRCRDDIPPDSGSHATCPGCGLVVDLALAETFAGAPRLIPERNLSGTSLGAYQLERCLGAGGMGSVYFARRGQEPTAFAVKVLLPELAAQPDFVSRFARESAALREVEHANVVGYVDHGEQDGTHYFAMEYVPGVNLEEWLHKRTPSIEETTRIVEQIAAALAAAHVRGIVHRDLKPSNVIVDGDVVKVLDFGIAQVAVPQTTLTSSNAVLGSFNYMAPEQRRQAKTVDARADIFSLGVILYRMLTGELPVGSFEPPRHLNPEVPKRLDALVTRALQRDPERRFDDADDLLVALHGSTRSSGVTGWVAVASAAAVVLLGTGAGALWFNGEPQDPKEQLGDETTLAAESKDSPDTLASQQLTTGNVDAAQAPDGEDEGGEGEDTEEQPPVEGPIDTPEPVQKFTRNAKRPTPNTAPQGKTAAVEQRTEKKRSKAPPLPAGVTWFRVNGVANDDVLNVRQKASPKAPVVGTFAPDTRCVRFLGRQRARAGSTWVYVRLPPPSGKKKRARFDFDGADVHLGALFGLVSSTVAGIKEPSTPTAGWVNAAFLTPEAGGFCGAPLKKGGKSSKSSKGGKGGNGAQVDFLDAD